MMIDRADLVTRARYLEALRKLSRGPNLRQRRAVRRRKAQATVRAGLLALLAGWLFGLVMAP